MNGWDARQAATELADHVTALDGDPAAFVHLCDAITELSDLREGIIRWPEVDPDITSVFPEAEAEDLLNSRITTHLDNLLVEDTPTPFRPVEDIQPAGGVL